MKKRHKRTKASVLNLEKLILALICFCLFTGCKMKEPVYCVAPADNNLVRLFEKENIPFINYPSVQSAIESVPEGKALLLLASDKPEKITNITQTDIEAITSKKLRVYIEYAAIGVDTVPVSKVLDLERVVVSDSLFFKNLSYMSLLTVNACPVLLADTKQPPLLVVAKVAGFNKAEYGLENTPSLPLLYFYNEYILAATTPLSCFATARFMPERSWQTVWEAILTHLTGTLYQFSSWLTFVSPSFGETEKLPAYARKQSVEKGIEWFFNGCFLIYDSWKKDWVDKYMGDGSMPIGPELPYGLDNGDGTQGVLEGHCSYIYPDGKQKYRYWLRNDVQGESSMAFALSGKLLENEKYNQIARNLNDFSFSRFREGSRNNPDSASFGLLSWSVTNPGVYYGDDNARSVIGSLVTASVLGDNKWTGKILETIIGNFRTTGKNGFRGERLEEKDLQAHGWKYYWEGDKINPHPHFEAWPWASYLWLYAKTGYKPLLERTKTAIRITMEVYPRKWGWTNGIQQERARMLLPLAWLVRIEPTEEHKKWLDFMVEELLKNQVPCGAIREELGDPSTGMFGKAKSNEAYGKHEAPLIFNNGDPIADMLYTNNFAFIGLNEAVKATGNPKYAAALQSMSDFLTRIQVKSDHFKNVDGAWFRAFNFQNWDYWASNADAGWGAWSTLTGWIQSWIIATQAFIELDTSIWEVTEDLSVQPMGTDVIRAMITE